MANLFLDGIFDSNTTSPSSIKIQFATGSLNGLMVNEPSFSAQNKWGPLIENVSTLSDLSQLMESEGGPNIANWIGASVNAWKGTDPIKLSTEFYLINYKRGLNLDKNLKEFVKLASLEPTGAVSVSVHGGYMADVVGTNTNQKAVFGGIKIGEDFMQRLASKDQITDISSVGNTGTISIYFGNKFTIDRLLLASVNVTTSIVEVPDRLPLYYRVSASFVGTKPLLNTDVDNIL